MGTYVSLGFIFGIPLMFRIATALKRFQVDPTDPSRFAGAGRKYVIYTYTGYANNVSKGSSSYMSGGAYTDSSGNVTESVSTTVVIRDQFFLTDANGNERAFQLSDFDAAVGNGHLVSVAWAVRKHKKTGPYFLVANHTTHGTYFNDAALYTIQVNHKGRAQFNFLLFLFFPVGPVLMLTWVFAMRAQRKRFKRSGATALVDSLEVAGSRLPQHGDLKVDDLDRLAAFAQEGLLTSEEWTRAKDLFLGKPPDARSLALSHLRQIHGLYKEGALSESEFNSKKWEILSRVTIQV